jgi:hypothetical protein
MILLAIVPLLLEKLSTYGFATEKEEEYNGNDEEEQMYRRLHKLTISM